MIIGNLAINNQSYSKLNIEDILKALNTSINFESDGLDEEMFESARDHGIWCIGKIIYNQYKYINTTAWVSKFLSYFPLDLKFKQQNSYNKLCWFLNNEDAEVIEVLLGKKKENLPSIIIMLANVIYTDHVDDWSNDEIIEFFGELKDDNSFHKFVKIAKEKTSNKILETLNKEFPGV